MLQIRTPLSCDTSLDGVDVSGDMDEFLDIGSGSGPHSSDDTTEEFDEYLRDL